MFQLIMPGYQYYPHVSVDYAWLLCGWYHWPQGALWSQEDRDRQKGGEREIVGAVHVLQVKHKIYTVVPLGGCKMRLALFKEVTLWSGCFKEV